MELEKQNIEMARKLLKNAMQTLDEKFRMLPSNEDDITLDQACDIMKNYDLVNYLRNIIINQLAYLRHESAEKEEAKKYVEDVERNLAVDLEKINGFKNSRSYPANTPVDQFSYYRGLQKIQKYFSNQDRRGFNEFILKRFKNAIDFGAREEGELAGYSSTIRDLFKPLRESLSNTEEIIEEPSKDLLFTTRTIISQAKQKEEESKKRQAESTQEQAESAHSLLVSTLASKILRKESDAEKLKETAKKQSQNLTKEMLIFSLDAIEQMKDTPQSKIKWLNLLKKEHEDILTKEETIAKRIDVMIEHEKENEKKNNDNILKILKIHLEYPPEHVDVIILDNLIRQLSNINLSSDLEQITGISITGRPVPSIAEEKKQDGEKSVTTYEKVQFDLSDEMKQIYKESVKLYEAELKSQIKQLLASNLSPDIKLQKLDKLVSQRSTYSKELVDIYNQVNNQLTSEIMAQVVDTNRDLLRKVTIEDLLNYRDDKPTKSLSKISNLFNKISHWVTLSILQDNINCRVLALERMINLSKECLQAGDFNAAMAIFAGMKAIEINRLKSTFDALSPTAKHNYTILGEIFNEASNYKNLKYATDIFDGPKMPYLGLYTADLEFFRKGNKNKEWSDVDIGVGIIAKFVQIQDSINQPDLHYLSNDRSFISNLEKPVNIDSNDYQGSSSSLECTPYYLSTLNEPKDAIVVANVSPKLLTQSTQKIPKSTSASIPKYLTILQGDIQLINQFDGMLHDHNLLIHKSLRSNLQKFSRERETEIHDHYEAERFVEISESEWQSIITKLNAIEGHPDFTDAKVEKLNEEQLLFINRYFKLEVKNEKGLISFTEYFGRDVVSHGKKIIEYNSDNTLDDLYLIKDGKLVKRNMSTAHQNEELVKTLLALDKSNKQELKEQDRQFWLTAEITKVMKDIDTILDVKIRQIFLRSLSVEVLNTYAYIINKKYDQLISLLNDNEIEKDLKNDLLREKERFRQYHLELLEEAKKNSQRNWIKESEQYRRLYGSAFNSSQATNKAEYKVFVEEGDLTPEQLMGYSTAPGSVFSSLSKTLWSVSNGGTEFHIPGDELTRHDPTHSTSSLAQQSAKNPRLLSPDELIYTQALNRYVVADVKDKMTEKTKEKVYIAATSAPQFNDTNSWDYHLLMIDPVQNSKENVENLMAHAEKIKTPGDFLDKKLRFLERSRIPTHDSVLEDLQSNGKKSRYLPMVNSNGEFILRNPDGSYSASHKMDINRCVLLDKEAYLKTRVKEIAAKLKGYDEWLKSQNKYGVWRAPITGLEASLWLGNEFKTRMNKEDFEDLFYQAYKEVLKQYKFERIKIFEFTLHLPEGQTEKTSSQYKAFENALLNDSLEGVDIRWRVGTSFAEGMSLTDFSYYDKEDKKLSMGIDAGANSLSTLGNEKDSYSTESIIINSALGAREASSPWISTELFNPNNWIIQTSRERVSASRYIANQIGDPEIIIEEKVEKNKSSSMRDYEIWLKYRNELYRKIKENKFDEFIKMLDEVKLSPQGKKQVIEAIFDELKNNNLNDEKLFDYNSSENVFILSIIGKPLLMAHYEFLNKYNENVGLKIPIPAQTYIELPKDFAILQFIEKTVRKYPGIYEKQDATKITEAMQGFISDLNDNVDLSSKDKLIICEKMFKLIRENILLNSKGEPILDSSKHPIPIYKKDEKEEPGLLSEHLPKDRKLLIKKQIELIDLLKEASIAIVAKASEGNISVEGWKNIKSQVEQEDSVINFHNSNTPLEISTTGTRKKIDNLVTDSISDFMEIIDLIIKSENKYMSTRKQEDLDKMIDLVQKYLGKPGISGLLQESNQKKLMKLAVEHENEDNKNPLLKLVKQAGPKLREAIADSKIIKSSFWENHVSTQEKLQKILEQPVVATSSVAKPSANISRKSEAPAIEKAEVASIVTSLQYNQILPYEQYVLGLIAIDNKYEEIRKILDLHTSDEVHQKLKEEANIKKVAEASGAVPESLPIYEKLKKELNDLRQELTNRQINLTAQISFIADLDGPLNEKQAMIIICDFKALLADDYEEAVKILDKFDKDLFSRLQEKLQNFSDIDPKLNDIIGQLNMALSYLGADFKDDYKKMFEMFSDSYQALSPMMQSSKELGDYYEEINKKIEEMKSAPQMISSQFPSQEILSPTGQVEVPTLSIISSDSLSIASESRKPSVESRASQESIDIKALFTDEHREAVIPAPDLKSQPSRIIPLLDVDMTLVMGGGKYNDELINALIEKGITEVYLFTSYAVGGGGAGSESNLGSRNELIKYLDKKGIKVQGVIVEDDVLYNKRPGAWYEEKLRPLEIAAMEGKLDKKARDLVENLEKEMRMGISMEEYNNLTREEQKRYEQKARNNSPNKGDMYKYVVSHFGNQHTYIFIDDDFKYNIPKVRDAAKKLGSNLIAIPVTPEKKKIQFLDGMDQRRDWIKESEQYRRIFDIKDVRTKPEFKVVVKEGDLTDDQLMAYSNVHGSVFNSLTKTLWMVMNGGKAFHVPGVESPRTAQNNKALAAEVKKNPQFLMNENEFVYTQAVNRYVIANIENSTNKHQVITTPNVYIAATAAPQLDDPDLWDYHLLIIDPIQNTPENVRNLMQKANAMKKSGDILDKRLKLINEKIPSYVEIREDYDRNGEQSRYMPLKNKSGLYIVRKPDGSYATSNELNDECIFIDKEAYIQTKVQELEAKMKGFDNWLVSQNKEGEWRALDAGVGAFAWLGGVGPSTHANLLDLHDQAYQRVLQQNNFKNIKAIQSQRNIFTIPLIGMEFKKLPDGMTFEQIDTDFTNCLDGRLMGIDACADARTPLGNEKLPQSAEPGIINAAPGARAAGSPWVSPELLHPDNWIIELRDGTRISCTEYLKSKKNISTIEEMREIIDERKPVDIRDLELWNKNREKIFKLNDDKDYGALNIILKQFSERGRRQIADVILEKLRKDILVDKDKESLIQDMKKFIFALHGLNLKHSEKLQICEDLFVMIRDRDYKAEEDENASLFENLLPADRKPALLNKQIELLKLLKDAYVDVVMDAVSSRKPQEELNAIREKLSNKKGLVDFQNSNTPVTVTTGTRKKVDQLLVTPQMTKADKELYQEITNLKVDDLNKIVDGILLAQENNDIKTATKYVQEYLGRRKYGILTRNFREDFIEIAIEKGDFEKLNKSTNRIEPSSPLLRLVKNAGPELKKAIAETELLNSHFWKGHDTSKNYISEALYKGRLTLEDFKKYRDKFADKKASELKTIKERNELLYTAIKEIKSDAIRLFLEKQIQEIRIDFLESDKFADFLIKFINPMIAALNMGYIKNQFPANYNELHRYLDDHKDKISFIADVGMFYNRKFADAFNKAMSHESTLIQVGGYNSEFKEITVMDFSEQFNEFEDDITRVLVSAQTVGRRDNELFNNVLNHSERLSNDYRRYQKDLILIKEKLMSIFKYIKAIDINREEREKYTELFDKNNGVEAKLAIIESQLQRLSQINKEHLEPLQKICAPAPERNSLVDSLRATFTKSSKSSP